MSISRQQLYSFPDQNQNFWQLASIQAAALGFPVVLVGGNIAASFGTGTAIASILIGNLILWLIGLAIIGMASYRANAFETAEEYLGKEGKLAFALVVTCAFLGWYTLQAKSASTIIGHYLSSDIRQQIRIGAILGILIAMFSMGGIRFVKWLNVISLPIFIVFFLYLISISQNTFSTGSFSVEGTLSGILSIIFIILPGILNLPTFFRHSKSKAHSFLALTVMTALVALFQCFSVWIGVGNIKDILDLNMNPIIIVGFTVLSLFCINTVNIYLASGAFEVIVRRSSDARDYAVLGLAGTGAFALLQALPIMTFLENMISGFIASFGVALIAMILIKIIVKHRPRFLERVISNFCWFAGAAASLIYLVNYPSYVNKAIVTGMGVSALAFLIVIFIEETIWAFSNSSIRHVP